MLPPFGFRFSAQRLRRLLPASQPDLGDRRDEGAHIDTSLALAYVAALREAFLTELSVGERVQTPLGSGEVRYVSGDGANAAVKLDNDYEVWLPAERVLRPNPLVRRAS
jgi:hypothetical protein